MRKRAYADKETDLRRRDIDLAEHDRTSTKQVTHQIQSAAELRGIASSPVQGVDNLGFEFAARHCRSIPI